MAHSPSARRRTLVKIMLGLAAIVLIVIAARQFNLQAAVQQALTWVQNLGATGAIAYMGIYVLATILFLPGSLLTLGGGAIYGVGLGSLYVFLAASLGATLAFLIGRYLARAAIAKRIAANPKFQAIDNAIAEDGLKIVILARLSPIFPFNLLNYALGLTQVSLTDYLIGFIGMIPGTVMYVYLGALAGSLATIGTPTADPQAQTLQWALQIVGLLATIAVTLYITQIAKTALDERVHDPE